MPNIKLDDETWHRAYLRYIAGESVRSIHESDPLYLETHVRHQAFSRALDNYMSRKKLPGRDD
jgi:hypothetical protein